MNMPVKQPQSKWVTVKIPREAYEAAQKLLETVVRDGWKQKARPTLGTVILDALQTRLRGE